MRMSWLSEFGKVSLAQFRNTTAKLSLSGSGRLGGGIIGRCYHIEKYRA